MRDYYEPSVGQRVLWYFINPAYEWSTIITRIAGIWASDLKESGSIDPTLMQSLSDRRKRLRSAGQKLFLLNIAVLSALLLSHFGVNIGISMMGISAADLSKLRDPLLAVSVTLLVLDTCYELNRGLVDSLLKSIIGNETHNRNGVLYLSDIDFFFFPNITDVGPGTLSSALTMLLGALVGFCGVVLYLLVYVLTYIIGISATFRDPSLPYEWSMVIGYYAILSISLSVILIVLITLWPHRFVNSKVRPSLRAAQRLGRDQLEAWWYEFGRREARSELLFHRLRSLQRFRSRPSNRDIARRKRRQRAAERERIRNELNNLRKERKELLRETKEHNAAIGRSHSEDENQ